MGFMKKSNDDFLDLTLLQKRGLLKMPKQREDAIDLTKSFQQPSSQTTENPVQNNFNPLSMLDSMPSASQPSPFYPQADVPEVSSIKIKLEDLEFKLENLIQKISLIESKLSEFERKASS